MLRGTMVEDTTGPRPSAPDEKSSDGPPIPPWLSWILIVGAGLALATLGPRWNGSDVDRAGWRLTGVFAATILALMLRPLPGGAAVLIGVMTTALVGALPLEQALAGYTSPTVWLVLAAFFFSRAFIKTGLARRIALVFIRVLGQNSLGLSYALLLSDTVLAGMIPSNAARVGGVLLPIGRSLAELYESFPGRSAGRLGGFLMLALYQTDVVACALFFTGQASNPLIARMAFDLTADRATGPVEIGYAQWLWQALVPAVVSLALVPWLVYRWHAPMVKRTPDAALFAARELAALGRTSRREWGLLAIFILVCFGWIWLPNERTTLVALAGVAGLLLTRILTWEEAVAERAAWDVFIWYGGLVEMGKQLHEAGVTSLFARSVAAPFEGLPWMVVFLGTLLVYYYAHYGFASITAHALAMYPPFVLVLLASGAPPALVVFAFATFANLAACLTHYGTTPGPILFSAGYVSVGAWWRVGALLSLVHLVTWLTIGMIWWRLLGLW